MTDLQVGDIVLPVDYREYEAAFKQRPLRVTHVFKNGNIRAKTDDGRWRSDGPAEYFYRPDFEQARCGG
ncbi:Uncharacterised protein (plasmid) [Tsukamurella tyrosinosolvens]|uniref:Uncharacterized protein n=1 Tax=Tsukamurella tyrosinosolvens TaxID=57704 RepID=A0A1H4VPP2_TSUTY|nr:hypothetical protein [Tsukamurella tyrosinosolvens]KXO90919.1 hypothetical protein AXK58_21025 [Tsukamurella tyrosinosolvens]SEC83026.1 hypothetical protein SAMN04489793_3297 [Tsukamurella tyrosinosolvens]VEH90379.1 Uncharacterised protein [Tsukamurella tyrosinosolvens]